MDLIFNLVIGLPCSGKTFFLNEKRQLGYTIVDDPISFIEIQKAVGYTESGVIYVADCNLCKSETLEQAKNVLRLHYPDANINCIYFENAPEKCLNLYRKRGLDGDLRSVENYIKMLSKIYNPPSNSLPIWSDKS